MAPFLQGMGGPGAMGGNPFAGGFGAVNGSGATNNTSNSTEATSSPAGATPIAGLPPFTPNPALLQMLMGATGAAGTGGRPPEEVYEVQLRQLQVSKERRGLTDLRR